LRSPTGRAFFWALERLLCDAAANRRTVLHRSHPATQSCPICLIAQTETGGFCGASSPPSDDKKIPTP